MSDNGEQITWPSDLPFTNVFQFKITVDEIEPLIWRRLVVPESYTLYDFHVAIQNSLGWRDSHCHNFQFDNEKERTGFVIYECPWTERWSERDDWIITTKVPLKDHFNKAGDKGLYRYDYGDGWELEVHLEDIYPKEKEKKYPVCIDGALAGPPEDCGGVEGYSMCVKATEGGDDDDAKELLVWLGDWRPDVFNADEIHFESSREHFKKSQGK